MLLLGMQFKVAFILIMIFILPCVMPNSAMKINRQTYDGDNFVGQKYVLVPSHSALIYN